ncbi:MAG: pyridoxal phosphate-dependent aminotransferase family protein [Leptolyngbya sp. PLA3]|nr:MAG: pyridoxal phosphate-dependent aminotransferase family protein [Cyanobacteria bacterium CYA]MCE7968112.1 pyridoxal phosphate-dependent aminotransferase family protein [Leptolyngbya sp. PL-A3]
MTGPEISSAQATTFEIEGRQMLSFAGCNYLALAHHPRVLTAASEAITRFGLSTSASRETSGNTILHAILEREVAEATRTGDALIVPDGYTANLAAAQTLARLGVQHAIIDERAHRSLFDAAAAAGLTTHRYATADSSAAAAWLTTLSPSESVIFTDGVFTADGRIAPLVELSGLGCRLLIDDCHGFGLLGPAGAGTHALLGVKINGNLILTSTLAKGIGCAGGFVAGSTDFIEAARRFASAYICTTPTAPPLIAAAIEAVRIARSDDERRTRLASNSRRLAQILAARGLGSFESQTPIFAFSPGDEIQMRALAGHLAGLGLFVPLIAYPGGPCPLYFRASVTSEHNDEDLACLDEALGSGLYAPVPSGVLSQHA